MAHVTLKPDDYPLLAQVAELYRRQLHGDDAAGRQLLRKLKIQSSETIEAFGLGWSDGKLSGRVTDDQRIRLIAMGLLRKNKTEPLASSLIIPVLNPASGVVDFFTINAKLRVSALYHDPHGLLNHAAIQTSREIVVTDSPVVAMMIHQAGWRAVVCALTAENIRLNIALFERARTDRVWLAVKHLEAFTTVFTPLGCDVLPLDIPRRITDQTLLKQMEKTQRLQHIRARPKLIEAVDDAATFEFSGCQFKVVGISDKPENMKLVLHVHSGDATHTDRVDLLTAAARRRFARDASQKIPLDRDVLEGALLDLVNDIERVIQSRRREHETGQARSLAEAELKTVLPEDRRQAALTTLRDPKLLDTIVNDITTLGLVGESDNARLLYLVATSRKLQRPLSAILRSESASGKSSLVEKIIDLLPEDDVVYVSRLSTNALFFMPPDALRHRLLVVEEREGGMDADYAVRILQSKGFLTTALPLPPEDGIMRTKLITVQGPVAYVETTTMPDIDPQNLNRCFEVRLDESSAQTARIIIDRHQRRTHGMESAERDAMIERHRDLQRLISSVAVAIPFANLLAFPNQQVRFRRDHERLLGLIDASALLHQHQRQWKTTPGGNKFIVASIADYEVAYRLSIKALALAVDELPANARTAWEAIRKLNGRKFSRRELMAILSWRYWKTFSALVELRRLDLISVEVGSGQSPAQYQASAFAPVRPELGLIAPDELASKLK